MDHYSKVAVILGLFFAIAVAEKKINLEDIERDNLRAESKSGTESIRAEETSYGVSAKPETVKQKYQQETRQYENDEENSRYVAPQQLHDKYTARPEDYQQGVKYLANNVDYQQTAQPIQYADYEQQVETAAPKGSPHTSSYETPQQQLYYHQPEVPVENQYQQKTTAENFAKNSNKETLYVNIPMAQLLSYYPNIALGQSSISKSQSQPLVHSLSSQANQQIAIPIYMPPLIGDPIHSNSKITYQTQPQYTSQASRYPQITEAILPTKPTNRLIYHQGLLSHRQPRPNTHYLQEIIYTQQPAALAYVPTISTSHDANAYEGPSSTHLEPNALSQNYASQSRNQQSYAPYDHQSLTNYVISTGNYQPQQTNQIHQQQTAENVRQDYENIPNGPGGELDLPKLPAKNFKSAGNTRSSQIPRENEASHYSQNHLVHSSGPRSLLDSYIPSNLLAAQDSERYRERPITLERGFLPSKINYVHQSYKKRTIE